MEDLSRVPMYELYSRLSDNVLDILKESSTLANTIRNVEQQAVYWKEKTENLVGLYLPFEPEVGYETEYWRDLYASINSIVSKIRSSTSISYNFALLFTGKYECIWIALNTLQVKDISNDYMSFVFISVVAQGDIDALELILNYVNKNRYTVNWGNIIKHAVSQNADDMFDRLLDEFKLHPSTLSVIDIIKEIGFVGNIEYFKKITSMFSDLISIDEAAHIAYKSRTPLISPTTQSLNSVLFLRYILSLPSFTNYRLSDYGHRYYLSEDAAVVLASSDNVIIDEIPVESPYIARILYDSAHISDGVKVQALKLIGEYDDVLEDFLSKHEDVEITDDILEHYMSINNGAFGVATRNLYLDANLLHYLLTSGKGITAPIPFKYIKDLLMQQLDEQ